MRDSSLSTLSGYPNGVPWPLVLVLVIVFESRRRFDYEYEDENDYDRQRGPFKQLLSLFVSLLFIQWSGF